MALYSDFHKCIYLIGDCQASVNGQLYTQSKASDAILSAFRSLILHINPNQHQEARDAIMPYLVSTKGVTPDQVSFDDRSYIAFKVMARSSISKSSLYKTQNP